MKDFLIHREAENELIDALVHHDRHWRGWGRDLHAEIQAAFDDIRRQPTAFPVWRRNYRMRIVPDLPYTIFFLNLPASVWVAAIAHNKRRPGYWTRRRPPRPGP